jgi:lipopolysaccharide transport system ATP-binding protein
MDKDVVVKVEHVSKKYCKALKNSMLYGIQDIGRNLCGLSSRSERLRKEEFWAVDDVSFELNRGDSLGLIGPNGSGKSTLLKMLNGIFWPDKGKITIKGRVGALIEVGAGFHPLLTGRENVYVNGAILGMTKQQIDEQFEDIVKFADIDEFIDAPVKSYSSGMFVRLGFSIAIHSKPDILLIDEALAVGDAAFRSKCFKRMQEIKSEKNISIVYVSHDLYSTELFCEMGLFLNRGKISTFGDIHSAIRDYQSAINRSLSDGNSTKVTDGLLPHCTGEVQLTSVKFTDEKGQEKQAFSNGETLRIRINFDAKQKIQNPVFQLSLWTSGGQLVAVFGPHLENVQIPKIDKGPSTAEFRIPHLPLLANKYYMQIGIYDKTRCTTFDLWSVHSHAELSFEVLPNFESAKMGNYCALCHFDNEFLLNGETLKQE